VTTTTTASHLQFYAEHAISPVRQDISGLVRHFERREALYRHLGILPAFVRGCDVLEVGPGSGFNALYTAWLRPRRYVLVEGNPTGIEHMRELFAQNPELTQGIEIVHSRIEDWEPEAQYDFVFCEGVLSGVPNPEEILATLTRATVPGGVLVVTCVDHLSHFPETVRRAFAQRVVHPSESLEAKTAKILSMMDPHLSSLPGMSRRHDDWVIDNLIHPASIIPLVNIPETIAILAPQFDFYAASPHFVADWRWYKAITGDTRDFNIPALEQYWQVAHNLMDYRVVLPPREMEANQQLYELCTRARRALEFYERLRSESYMIQFTDLVGEIGEDIASVSSETGKALVEAHGLLAAAQVDPRAVAAAKRFSRLFGRGQQYISFTRRATGAGG